MRGWPWLKPCCPPACSVGTLPRAEYWKVGFYFVGLLLVYLLYSLPMSYIKHSRVDSNADEDLRWARGMEHIVHVLTPPRCHDRHP